eukprot:3559519-Rhodomonas_salina.1
MHFVAQALAKGVKEGRLNPSDITEDLVDFLFLYHTRSCVLICRRALPGVRLPLYSAQLAGTVAVQLLLCSYAPAVVLVRYISCYGMSGTEARYAAMPGRPTDPHLWRDAALRLHVVASRIVIAGTTHPWRDDFMLWQAGLSSLLVLIERMSLPGLYLRTMAGVLAVGPSVVHIGVPTRLQRPQTGSVGHRVDSDAWRLTVGFGQARDTHRRQMRMTEESGRDREPDRVHWMTVRDEG